jgi:hypothetical protein
MIPHWLYPDLFSHFLQHKLCFLNGGITEAQERKTKVHKHNKQTCSA